MAQAGASIEAFLKLDASEFKSGMEGVKESVKTFKASFEGLEKESKESIGKVLNDIKTLKESFAEIGRDSILARDGFQAVQQAINSLNESIVILKNSTKEVQNFKTLAQGMNQAAEAAQRLTTVAERGGMGIEALNSILATWKAGMESATITVTGLSGALRELASSTEFTNQSTRSNSQVLANLRNSYISTREVLLAVGASLNDMEYKETRVRVQTEQMANEFKQARQWILDFANGGVQAFNKIDASSDSLRNQIKYMEEEFKVAKAQLLDFANGGIQAFGRIKSTSDTLVTKLNAMKMTLIDLWNLKYPDFGATIINSTIKSIETLNSAMEKNRQEVMTMITGQEQYTNVLERNSIAMRENGAEKLRAMGYTGKLSIEEQKDTNATNQNTSAHQRNASAMSQASARANQLTSATSRLSKAMSSLKMMGSLVGSMLAYNFAHKLLVATGETIHAKSEMEGYFKMLNFGQSDIDHFNQALDRTVSQFQRVNKYSLGETISSIGVEFNLTTQEMEKAMEVTSMITSEYLRAGRNANEASLAVKDVLQGQFQRLSRETGVKGEDLKKAGWSGDTSDVLGLMEALEKVGESRNWDVFAEKANSLNDIITILQNRFGEWSADMVNVVQPSIVNAFNAIMSVSQGLANILSGFWQWLNTDGWGQLAIKIGMVGTALLTTSQMLVMYRANVGLVEASQLGLKNSIASVVLGLKGQEVAEVGVRNAIMSKILGVNAEAIAENGVTGAIAQKIASLQASTIQQQANTLATGENTTAQTLSTSTTTGLATAKEMETAQEEVNTAMKELNTLETLKQEGANTGLIASLYMLGTAELYDAEATGVLATAWGVLNGVFALSPIGWIIAGITAIAGAIYVLTGGLDSMWGSLQNATKAVDDASSATKPYRDYVEQTNKELEEAKTKYGENSLIVQQLSEKYDRAKTSLDGYYHKLQDATSQHGKLNEELSVTSAKMDEIMRDKLGGKGYDASQIEEMTTGISDLSRLQDHDYVALQKHNAMLGNFTDNIDKFADSAKDDTEAIETFGKTYWDFINYSDKANTADNWWDWATNSAMAGISSTSLDIQKALHGVWDDNLGLNKYYDEINNWLTDMGNAISNFDLGKYFGDIAGGVGEYFGNALGGIGESVQNFINDPLGSLGISLPENWNILSLFGLNPVSAGDGSSDHPSILEDLKQGFGVDIQAFIDGMSTDPLGTLGITGAITDITTFLSQLIPISFESVTGFVQNNLIIPFGQAVYNGIMSIPLVGDILSLFGLVNGENSGASQKGNDLATSFKTKLEEVIRNIPILGDILQLLGIIPQANPTASSNGQGVGSSIKTGFKNGLTGMAQIIQDEINHILNALGDAINQAGQKALELGNAIVSGVRNAIDPGSPGIIAREIIGNEFGTYIPQVISNNSEMAYMSAQTYGQSVVDGISSVNFNSFGALATDYETDAQTMISTTQLLGLDTTMAFNDMALAVNNTTNTMGTNVIGTYNSMSTQQSSMLQNMKTQNMTAYNDMYQKSNQSLIQMRDSTSNLTAQMTNAWRHMKDQIVATANQLKSESTSHFNQLSNTIGEFYRKIQNPANWGAGSPDIKEGTRRPMVGRRIGKAIHHGAGGGNPIRPRGSSTMSIAQLKKAICPNGDCGSLFDGYSFTDKVDVETFLMSVIGEHGFGWNDWSGTHYNYIKTKSDDWDMKSPTINLVGGIPTNANYKVGDFENGSPKISFESFQSMAESIFSAIPYRFYYDSSWKGSWLGALQAGACNCWDGANALIAFANTCGFSGSIAHGSWNGIPHVWAVIEGRKMDTTGWQNRGTWTPSASAGSPMVRRPIHDGNMNQDTTPVQIEVNINGNVYGVDDLDSHISESIDKGLEKHFNKAYTIGV